MEASVLSIEGCDVKVTHLDKKLWPEEGITKGDLIEYYIRVWPYIRYYLEGRPLSLVRYPHGIEGEFFYHKDFPDAPPWVERLEVRHHGKPVHYVMVNNPATLVWCANLGSIEVHPWLSKNPALNRPTYAVFDLDPMEPCGLAEAVEVALAIKTLTERLGLYAFPKISGATGIHIYLPIEPLYEFSQTAEFVRSLSEVVVKAMPDVATNERSIIARGGRVYIDYLQNLKGKTIASVYSVRPFPGARVSYPCGWDELADIDPYDYTIRTVPNKLSLMGDKFDQILSLRQTLPAELLGVSPKQHSPSSRR